MCIPNFKLYGFGALVRRARLTCARLGRVDSPKGGRSKARTRCEWIFARGCSKWRHVYVEEHIPCSNTTPSRFFTAYDGERILA
mmetsp:Transcript_17422/g.37826  ORF Transcript_17422/g.37826 Transcript_17422/m.37826 type:complete len:84 (+) Transcript_17422:951-1202(+)